jgi:ATP synthase protein I
MLKVILLQSGLVGVVAAIAAGLIGAHGAISVLLGGTAYVLPNLLFVLRLKLAAASNSTNVMTFFLGEVLKVVATIGILVVAQRLYEVHWICLLLGLGAALTANFFAFLLKN